MLQNKSSVSHLSQASKIPHHVQEANPFTATLRQALLYKILGVLHLKIFSLLE